MARKAGKVEIRESKGGKSNGKKDAIAGRWSTEDGMELTFRVLSNNTPSKRYFAIAGWRSFNGAYPERYKGYADSNSNGIFDPGIDAYTGVASVESWDGTPRFSGTFRANGGILESSYSGGTTNSFSIPDHWFG